MVSLVDALDADVRDALVLLARDLAGQIDAALDTDERGKLIRLFLATTRDLETLDRVREREARLSADLGSATPTAPAMNPVQALLDERFNRDTPKLTAVPDVAEDPADAAHA